MSRTPTGQLTDRGMALILGLAIAVAWLVYLGLRPSPLNLVVGIAALGTLAVGVFGPPAQQERFLLISAGLAGILILANTLALVGVHLA